MATPRAAEPEESKQYVESQPRVGSKTTDTCVEVIDTAVDYPHDISYATCDKSDLILSPDTEKSITWDLQSGKEQEYCRADERSLSPKSMSPMGGTRGSRSRLSQLHALHAEKQRKFQNLARQKEEQELQEIRHATENSKRIGSRKWLDFSKLSGTEASRRLYKDHFEGEARLQEKRRYYDTEEALKIEETKERSRPTRRHSDPGGINADETVHRLYYDAERRERDRQQAREAYDWAVERQLKQKSPIVFGGGVKRHFYLYEEAAARKERLEARRLEVEELERKRMESESIHAHTSVDSSGSRWETLYDEHNKRQQKLAVMIAEERSKQAAAFQKKDKPTRRPSIIDDPRSPRSVNSEVRKQKDEELYQKRKKERAAREYAKYCQQTPQPAEKPDLPVQHALKPILSAIQVRAGDSQARTTLAAQAKQGTKALKVLDTTRVMAKSQIAIGIGKNFEVKTVRSTSNESESERVGTISLDTALAHDHDEGEAIVVTDFDSFLNHPQLVAPMKEIVKVYRDARITCEQSEGFASLCARPSQRLFQERLLFESEGQTRFTMPDCVRQVEEHLDDLMRSAAKAQVELRNAIGGPAWRGNTKRAHPDGMPLALFAQDSGAKTAASAKAKALVYYGPSEGKNAFRHLLDLSRVLLVFSNCELLQTGLEQLLTRFEVVDVRNYFHTPGRLGMRFVELLLIMNVRHGQDVLPHVCEVRLEELCYHKAQEMAKQHMDNLVSAFHNLFEGTDIDFLAKLVDGVLTKPPCAHDLRVFRCQFARRYGTTVGGWRTALGGQRFLHFEKFREACHDLKMSEHCGSLWQGLDPTLSGCASLFDFDPDAVALLIRLRGRLRALVDSSQLCEWEERSLFDHLNLIVRPLRPGHLQQHEFRNVGKHLGFTAEQADKLFAYLDSQSGYNRAPPATITAQDLGWLIRLPNLVDIDSVTAITLEAEPHDGSPRQFSTFSDAAAKTLSPRRLFSPRSPEWTIEDDSPTQAMYKSGQSTTASSFGASLAAGLANQPKGIRGASGGTNAPATLEAAAFNPPVRSQPEEKPPVPPLAVSAPSATDEEEEEADGDEAAEDGYEEEEEEEEVAEGEEEEEEGEEEEEEEEAEVAAVSSPPKYDPFDDDETF